MIQGAVIRVIGVVLGLFVIFSVVSPVAGGLDELYLYSIATCNFGTEENPNRAAKFVEATAEYDPDNPSTEFETGGWNNPGLVFMTQRANNGTGCALDNDIYDNFRYVSANGSVRIFADISIPGLQGISAGDPITAAHIPGSSITPTWEEPAGLFSEQPQLVELLATIAALALPLGALGAVVFFGNTISVATGTSGVSSQIIAVITIVVVILVIVEVFGQFIVYLDDAFEVIDKDRFIVYDNGLGTLAETITSFWGILAFASVLPIGFSLFRQYQSGGGIAGFGGSGRGI